MQSNGYFNGQACENMRSHYPAKFFAQRISEENENKQVAFFAMWVASNSEKLIYTYYTDTICGSTVKIVF